MSRPQAGRNLAYAGWVGIWLVLAAVIWAWALPQQIERGCWVREWPFEDGCDDLPSRVSESNTPQVYLEHLRRNIGDGHSWARLVRSLWRTEDAKASAVLVHARQIAPTNTQVLMVEAESASRAQDWPRMAKALVALLERGYGDARQPLLAMMLTPETQSAVLATLTKESRWLDGMLGRLDTKVPIYLVEPFVSRGSQLGILNQATSLVMIERLQRDGDWLDAYSLWIAMRGKVAEGLFNAGFDQRSTRRAFDWQWPQNARSTKGLRISQVTAAPRPGQMLEVEMTGRSALPQSMVMQPILLLARKYRFSGRFMSDRMRTEEGLVWALRCASGGDRFAQTVPMKETSRKWESFDVDVQVPAQCNGAVRMQLEAAAPWEAKAGMAGVIFFDDFELKPIDGEGSS